WTATTLPAGATLDPLTGVFTWTPNGDQARTDQYTFTVKTSDGSADGSTPVEITVTNVNRAPRVVSVPPVYGRENVEVLFQVAGSDLDGGNLTWSTTNLPAGAKFNPASGVVKWTPGFDAAGDYAVTFKLTDTGNLSDQTTVVIHVADANRTPVL